MKAKPKSVIALHVVEILYSLIVLYWLLAPLWVKAEGVMPTPFLPFRSASGGARAFSAFWAIAVFLPAVIAIFKLAAFFLDEVLPAWADPRRPAAALLCAIGSGLVLAAVIVYLFDNARSSSFFAASSPSLYAIFLLSVAFNAYFINMLISALNKRQESYKEYLQYKTSTSAKMSVREIVFQSSIQKKLIIFFVPLILFIIVVLSLILMKNFGDTITRSVIDNGQLLADRTANVIKSNPADRIAAEDYLALESARNASSAIPFHDITYYARDPKKNVFAGAASTDKAIVGASSDVSVDAVVKPVFRINAGNKDYEFLAPVTLGKALLGYVQVSYARDVIFEPYFRTQVKVISFAGLFIYISVFLTYLIGRTIVFPILFLRMSVATISSSLAAMIRGEKRISADLLQFQDRVATHDEIKGLSSEVGNMTAVIRGIVPYISASTLKFSERESPMTESRDLCFLFTDIRGFTTLCEGMTPEKVVEMLNHYLDIQSSIIIANHGDVDKFVGDEVMAMFEGPDKELNAVKTSLGIRKAMAEEKEKAIAANMNVVAIGIGINSGPVVFGSVGAKDRMDFTSIGDTVNLAARLEGANKAYGTKTLITDAVHDRVKDSFLCREVDMLTVKGKKLPVSVYEVVQAREIAGAHLFDLCKSFEEGLAMYRAQKWAKAEKVFKLLSEKYKDEASATFLGRMQLFKTNPPPADWDGVFNMTVK